MKKILLNAVLLSIIFVGACKKDSSAPTPNPTDLATKILGKWNFISEKEEGNGVNKTTYYTQSFKEFTSQGKLIETTFFANLNKTDIYTKDYTILTATTFTGTGGGIYTIVSIDDHNLVYYLEDFGVKYTMTLTK
jgi:nitrous oxide reductase accessory protein NosL